MPPANLFVTTTRASALPFLSNETVIFRLRRSLLFLILPILIVSLVGLALYLVITSQSGLPSTLANPIRFGIIGITLFIDLLIFLDWFTTTYVLTNRRVQYQFGIVGRQTKTISLEQITNSTVKISLFGRLFNFGNVVIDAANINSQIIFGSITNASTHLEQINEAQLGRTP